jgi:hypothetical protein
VRRLLVAIAGALGLGALWRRRQRAERWESLPAGEAGPDPADELRAKLAETRAADVSESAAAETPAGPEAEEPDPETRRRALHERARSSIDELR